MEWIPVTDKNRRPSTDKQILVHVPDGTYEGNINVSCFFEDEFWYEADSSPASGITHWMALPKPPNPEGL
jgi:hypothetical protein